MPGHNRFFSCLGSLNNKMIINTALVSLLLTTVTTMGQECSPPTDKSGLRLESTSRSIDTGYAAIQGAAEDKMKSEGGMAAKAILQRSPCSVSPPTLTVEAAARSVNKRMPWLNGICEACEPRVYYLRRFLRHCYVVYPYRQLVRYVLCWGRCKQPCWCSNSRCVPARYHLYWIWAYCTQDTALGFKQGLNYRWLWLPQDCQCKEF